MKYKYVIPAVLLSLGMVLPVSANKIKNVFVVDELTVEVGHDLIENHSGGPRALGVDPVSGGTVEVRNGRFGPYVALVMPSADAGADGDVAGDGKPKKVKSAKKTADRPKMASLFKTMSPESLT